MNMNLSEEEHTFLRGIIDGFEHCGSHGGCENCKAYERINDTECTFCELMLSYRTDIANKLTELIDRM